MSKRKKFVRPTEDRNFDDIADRFAEGIYGNLKGRVRLEVLSRDFQQAEVAEGQRPDLRVLDAGCGSAQFSCQFSKVGNPRIVLADPSVKMLEKAQRLYENENPSAHTRFIHSSVQELPSELKGGFDVVLFHAVLEWLIEPLQTLEYLLSFLKPGGVLSLLFYNKHGLVMRHLTLGNFHFVEKGYLSGVGNKSLTPISPQEPEDVLSWFGERDYELLCHSGVRCFYDLMNPAERSKLSDEDILRLELKQSQQVPYRDIARYVHLLVKKPLN